MRLIALFGVVLIAIVVVFFVSVLSPFMVFPEFAGTADCNGADVLVAGGEYSELAKEVRLHIQNRGSMSLELNTFITYLDGSVEPHPLTVYLSESGEGTFALSGIETRPREVTVQDKQCRQATDLWKF